MKGFKKKYEIATNKDFQENWNEKIPAKLEKLGFLIVDLLHLNGLF